MIVWSMLFLRPVLNWSFFFNLIFKQGLSVCVEVDVDWGGGGGRVPP